MYCAPGPPSSHAPSADHWQESPQSDEPGDESPVATRGGSRGEPGGGASGDGGGSTPPSVGSAMGVSVDVSGCDGGGVAGDRVGMPGSGGGAGIGPGELGDGRGNTAGGNAS